MNILRLVVLLIFFIIGRQGVNAQNSISLTQQQQDFTVFRTGIREMQPGQDWFISPQRFNALNDSIYHSLRADDEMDNFYYKLRFCLAALKSAHNGISLPAGTGNKTNGLPFVLRYLHERLYIKVNCSPNQAIPNGSELVSINGTSVKSLSNEFLRYCFSNGRNTSFAYQKLGVYSDFLNLLKALHPAKEYRLEIIPFQQKKKVTLTVPTQPYDTVAKYYQKQTGRAMNDWNPAAKKMAYTMLNPNEHIGYFKLTTFSGSDLGDQYQAQLDVIFDRIRNDKVKSLIVDIRGNGGGDDDVEQYLTSYFRAVPKDSTNANLYLQSDKFTQLAFVEQGGNLAEDNKLFQAFVADPYSIVAKTLDGRYKIKSELLTDDIKEKPLRPNAFQGEVYLLQNGLTFSAACAFAFRLKKLIQHDGGFIKVIGEDNGYDAKSGVSSGGYFVNLVLPNSKIKVWVPIVASGSLKPYTIPKDEFLDYRVTPTAKECVEEVDVELGFTKQLLKLK